ncbi:MAG: ABC transporter permease subunit [Halomonas sp.]
MAHEGLLSDLGLWRELGWIRRLEVEFSRFLSRLDPAADEQVLLAAALTSHQLGRGHVALPLNACLADPQGFLALPPPQDETAWAEAESAGRHALALAALQHRLQGLTAKDLADRLSSSRLVDDGPGAAPLVFERGHLYLRRTWQAETAIAAAIVTNRGGRTCHAAIISREMGIPCIVGTNVLSYGALVIALPWGIATAIYLNEYAASGRVIRLIRLGINNLAGVPSVVFGLFGLSLFVTIMGMGVSILAGVCTLGAFILPLVIGSAEEALRSVPDTYREASLGLGATKFQTISKVVFPAALPGMLTGSILGLARASVLDVTPFMAKGLRPDDPFAQARDPFAEGPL